MNRFVLMLPFQILFFISQVSCTKNLLVSPQALVFEDQCIKSLEAADFDAARIRCELCLEYDETVPECINGLGLVAFANGDDERAIARFTEAIQMNSSFAQARNNLGVVHFKNGHFDYALPFFDAATHIDPGFEDARYNAGLCHLKIAQSYMARNAMQLVKEEIRKSKDQYKKLIALNPEFSNAYRDLGMIALLEYEIGQVGEGEARAQAKAYFEQCVKLDPKNETCNLSNDTR